MSTDDASSIKDNQTDYSFSRNSVPGFGLADDPYDDDASNIGGPTADVPALLQGSSPSTSYLNSIRPKRFDPETMVIPNIVAFNGNVQADHVIIKPAAPPDTTVPGGYIIDLS